MSKNRVVIQEAVLKANSGYVGFLRKSLSNLYKW